MMSRRISLTTAVVLTTVFVLAACAKKTSRKSTARWRSSGADRLVEQLQVALGRAAVRLAEEDIFAQKTLAQLNAERPLGDVTFDYDMSALRDDARATLQRNADY
jgi:hypothetical protein